MTTKLLANQLKGLMTDPVEGFTVELVNESSLFEWKVYLEGPRDTCYEGGVFQLLLSFPKDYPMNPPSLRFISEFWHPNVYQKEGKVCISILHPPGDDVMSGELPSERWLPTQTVSTIILSVMSILSDPNCSSPANVDASVEWRSNRDSYRKRCMKLVEKANKAKPSHIVIPHPDSNPEEHKKSVERIKQQEKGMDIDYFTEDDYYQDEEEDEDYDDQDEDDNNIDEDDEDEDEDIDEEDEEQEQPKVNNQIVVVEQQDVSNDSKKLDSSNYNISIQETTTTTSSPSSSSPQPTENILTLPTTTTTIETNNNNNETTTSTTSTTTTTATTTIVADPNPVTINNNTSELTSTLIETTTSLTQPPANNNNNPNQQNNNINNNANNNNTTNNNNVRRKKKSKKCIIM